MEATPIPPYRAWRVARGLTQEALAQILGVRQSTISTVENGGPVSLDLVRRIVAVLDVGPLEAARVLVPTGEAEGL